MRERIVYEFYVQDERFVTDVSCPDGILDMEGFWDYIGKTFKKKREEVLEYIKKNGIEKAKEKYNPER